MTPLGLAEPAAARADHPQAYGLRELLTDLARDTATYLKKALQVRDDRLTTIERRVDVLEAPSGAA